MKRILTAALIFLAPTMSAHAQSADNWSATSSTAMAITGDIAIHQDKVVFENGVQMGTEVISNQDGSKVLRIKDNATKQLKKGNTLCGAASDPIDTKAAFLVMQETGKNMLMTVYAGDDLPVFAADADPKAKAKSDDKVCATYSFSK